MWYTSMPVWKQCVGCFNEKKNDDAHLAGAYTNHCLWGTSMMTLFREGLNLQEVANITRHSNLESLKCYLERPSKEDKAIMSFIFCYAQAPVEVPKSSNCEVGAAHIKNPRKQVETVLM